ncbi:MAG: hypothetical protein ABI321_00825 [Polyangia bacterium]
MFALAGIAALSACGSGRYFTDDGGKNVATSLLGSSDQLSLPYAVGAKVVITAHGLGSEAGSYQLRSDTPQVVTVVSSTTNGDSLDSTCSVLTEGTATLQLVDKHGTVRHEAKVVTKSADEARFYSHATLRIRGFDDASLAAALVTAPHIVVAGTSVFAVAYYAAGSRVYGSLDAIVTTPAGVTTSQKGLQGLTALFVTPSTAGDASLELGLTSTGAPLGSLALTAVPDTDITAMTLERQVSSPAENDLVWVQARTTDAAGREVFGAYSTFTLDGVAQAREAGSTITRPDGDLYRFHYESAAKRSLVATRGTLTATTQIAAKDGYVSDTQYLGCSAAPGSRPSRGALLFAMLIGVGALARRRAYLTR